MTDLEIFLAITTCRVGNEKTQPTLSTRRRTRK